VRTPSDASPPEERAEQAQELALRTPLTAQRGPTGRAGGPGAWPLGTFGAYRFDDVSGQDTRSWPHGQDQRRERLCFVDRAEQRLHSGIIMTYAVVQA
jgi:hypothetical protein